MNKFINKSSISAREIINTSTDNEYAEICEVVDPDNDHVECNFGLGVAFLSKEVLNGLLEGKVYWTAVNGGEYATLLVMKEVTT